jgi:hypothetical protein
MPSEIGGKMSSDFLNAQCHLKMHFPLLLKSDAVPYNLQIDLLAVQADSFVCFGIDVASFLSISLSMST